MVPTEGTTAIDTDDEPSLTVVDWKPFDKYNYIYRWGKQLHICTCTYNTTGYRKELTMY